MANGLPEDFIAYRSDLLRALPKLKRELGKEHRKISKVVVAGAQDRMQRTAKGSGGYLGARGIRASSSTKYVQIRLLGSNPRTFGDAWGAKAYGQFKPWKGNQWTGFDPGTSGYSVDPEVRDRREYVGEAVLDALEAALQRVYPRG